MSLKNKKMKTTFSVILISIILTGCHFSKSVKKDLLSGLTTTGDVLTCDDVYLTVNDERITRNSFIYGETFYIHYSDIQGFTKENGKVFPAMEMSVIDKSGDTSLYFDDLYSGDKEGLSYSPLELSAHLTVATPLRSKDEYMMYINISDKKGPGKYSSEFKFKVSENKLIIAEPDGVTYDEVYLYSQGNDKAITDGKIKYDDNIYIIIEGFKGFKEENGLVFPGLNLKLTDAGKNQILNYEDLFSEYDVTGISASDFASRVSSHFKLTGSGANNPLNCEVTIWDKKSNAKLKLTTDVTLE
jgi:hypothetical protein